MKSKHKSFNATHLTFYLYRINVGQEKYNQLWENYKNVFPLLRKYESSISLFLKHRDECKFHYKNIMFLIKMKRYGKKCI